MVGFLLGVGPVAAVVDGVGAAADLVLAETSQQASPYTLRYKPHHILLSFLEAYNK